MPALRKLSGDDNFFSVVDSGSEDSNIKTEITREKEMILLGQKNKNLACSLKIAQADIQKLNEDYANLCLKYKWLEKDSGSKGQKSQEIKSLKTELSRYHEVLTKIPGTLFKNRNPPLPAERDEAILTRLNSCDQELYFKI